MTIEDPNSIDAAGIDKLTGELVLVISDHLDWSDERVHFEKLDRKISRYLEFISSEQLVQTVPEATGRAVRIDVFYEHEPILRATEFFRAAQAQLRSRGIASNFGRLPLDY